MADDIVLGIDLGTTNSVVAVADAGEAKILADFDGKRLIPSVVSFTPDQVLVGDVARERRLLDAENTIYAMKRLIGRPYHSAEVRRAQERFAFRIIEGETGGVRVVARDRPYALAEISAWVLRECRRVAEQVLDQKVSRAVITVPANFNELQRSATKAAGQVAGLDVVRILNEPTAAAVAYGCGSEGAERVAVFDLGGGTFDITVLDLDGDVFEVVATAGDTFLGGDDIDLLIAEEMAFAFERDTGVDPRPDRQAFERLRAAGEWVKCQLSMQEDVTAKLAEVTRDSEGNPLPLAYRMTRNQLEGRILPLVDRAMKVTADALALGGLNVGEVDTVVLVGGSTRIPMVRRTVEEFFGRPPRIDIDPDLVVALGASVQGYALSHKRARRTITVFPSAEAVEAVKKKKEQAKQARPAQPAFAPQNYRPPSPSGNTRPGGSEAPDPRGNTTPGGSHAPAALEPLEPLLSEPPLELDEEDLQEVDANDPRLSRNEIANALFSTGAPAPLPEGEAPSEEMPFALTELHLPKPSKRPAESDLASAPLSAPTNRRFDPDGPTLDPAPAPSPATRGDPSLDGASLIELPEPQAAPRSGLSGTDLFSDAAAAAAVLPAVLGAEYMNPEEGSISIAMPQSVPPILMDVTPHSLGIQTAGGYCERVIRGNTPIPIEQTRMFTTAKDDQESVVVAICQGESRVYEENQHLGEIELPELPPGKRGQVRIQVTFMLDADGRLDVAASDQATGRSQTIRINLVGGFGDQELSEMRDRQDAEAVDA